MFVYFIPQRINHSSKMAMWGKWRAPAGRAGNWSEDPFLALDFPPPPPPLVRFVPFGGITWLRA